MNIQVLSKEDIQGLEFAPRYGGERASQYAPIIEAIRAGKNVKIDLEGTTAKAMSQRIYTVAKREDLKITIRTLADKSALVVGPVEPEAVTEEPTSGRRGRKSE